MGQLEGREVQEESTEVVVEIASDRRRVDDAAWAARDRTDAAAGNASDERETATLTRALDSSTAPEQWGGGEIVELHAEPQFDAAGVPGEVDRPGRVEREPATVDPAEPRPDSERLQEARESVDAAYAEAEGDGQPENTGEQFEVDAQRVIADSPSDTAEKQVEFVLPEPAKEVEFHEPGPVKEVEFDDSTGAESTDRFVGTDPIELGDASDQPERTAEVHSPQEQRVIDEAKLRLANLEEDGYILGGEPVKRAGQWHEQGQNDQHFQNDCGIAAVAATARDFGCDVSENDAVDAAVAQGLCEIDPTNERTDNGGTRGQDRHELLESLGVDNTIEHPQSPAELAQCVENGHGVITALDAYEMWDVSPFDAPTYYDADGRSATNHAVQVTGTFRDSAGELAGFVINDTGSSDGAGKLITLDMWDACWTNTWKDHETLVTRRTTSVEKTGR